MAARLNTRQIDKTASAIKTTKLVQKLQRHALEDEDMSATQIQAARILLNKTMPDQRAIDHQIDGSLTVNVVNYGTGQDSE